MSFVFLSIQGCGKCDCSDEMDSTRNKYGDPEEVNSYDSGGYHSESWWYWSKGKEFTFTWGSDVSECCDKSTYTFDPIRLSRELSDDEKSQIEQYKVLIEREITGDDDCLTCP